jgi:hypothetical protein
MFTPFRPALSALPLMALLAGCTLSSDYPSLAQRPIEKTAFDAPTAPVAAPPPAPIDAKIESQVATMLASAQSGDSAFRAALPATLAAVARAGGVGSEAWLDAQQEVTALGSLRGPVTAALEQLSALLTEQRTLDAPPDTRSLESAIALATQIDASEQADLDRLTAALPSP